MAQSYVAQVTTPTTPTATVYQLPYADEGHEWPDQMGYSPPIVAWLMPVEYATAILSDLGSATGAAREVILNLGDPDDAANYLTVERVVVLGTAPADNPQRCYMLFSNVLWYLSEAWMALDANMRRRVGDKYLTNDTLNSATPADVVAYAPWSLNAGAAFQYQSFATAVLNYLTAARHGRPAVSFAFDTFHVLSFMNNVIQETTTDANGSLGLARAIEALGGGASARVNPADGTIHICEATPTAETTLVTALPPPLNDEGAILKIDRSGIRPAFYFRIYFDYELELRCTYNASGTGLYSTVNDTDPYLIPVLRVTDKQLTIPGGTYFGIGTVAGRTVGQGSIIGQDEAFAAWGAPPGAGYIPSLAGMGPLTDDFVAAHWFDGHIGGGSQLCLSSALSGAPDPVWVARLEGLRRDYRTLFRVNPKAWDRVRHAWDVRAAVWDIATGSRSFSPVYANYNVTPADPTTDSTFPDLSVNVVNSYPTSGLLADGQPSKFRMVLVDDELGVLMVDRSNLSQFPKDVAIEVSDVVTPAQLDGAPGADEIGWQALRSATSGGSSAWKLMTIISVAPASPNDLRRLYEVLVDVPTAALTAGFGSFSQPCHGCDVEERSQLGQARVAWQDDTGVSDVIFNTLDFSGGSVITDEPLSFCTMFVGLPAFTGLRPINGTQEIVPIATALAAQKLLTMLDCYVGVQAIPGSKNAKPIGTAKRIVHKVTEGRYVSIVECVEPDRNQFRFENFLPAAARAYLLQTTVTQR